MICVQSVKEFLYEDLWENYVTPKDKNSDSYFIKQQILQSQNKLSILCQSIFLFFLIIVCIQSLSAENIEITLQILRLTITVFILVLYIFLRDNIQAVHRINILILISAVPQYEFMDFNSTLRQVLIQNITILILNQTCQSYLVIIFNSSVMTVINLNKFDLTIGIQTQLMIVFLLTIVAGMQLFSMKNQYKISIKTIENEQKSKILSQVSHEQRAQLNGIQQLIESSLQALSEKKPDLVYLKKALNDMKNINFFQNYLLSDYLDYNRMEKEKLKLINKNSNIEQIFDEVKNLFQDKLKEQNNTLTLIYDSKTKIIFNDPNRLKQIFVNFVSNSNKFTKNGQITVKIEDFKGYISVSVQDLGAGMSAKVVEKIGQDYMTFDNTQKNNEHGIGLGLSLCKQLISKMGPLPRFYVKSIEGKGTTIAFLLYKEEKQTKVPAELEISFKQKVLFLPFIKPKKEVVEQIDPQEVQLEVPQNHQIVEIEQEQPQISEDSEIILDEEQFEIVEQLKQDSKEIQRYRTLCDIRIPKKQKNFNIAIVDDQKLNLFGLNLVLNPLKKIYPNINVIEFCDGLPAYEFFLKENVTTGENNVHMMIIDENMTNLHGGECTKKIKQKISEGFVNTVIVGHSSDDSKDIVDNFIDNGAEHFEKKPISYEDMKCLLDSYNFKQ